MTEFKKWIVWELYLSEGWHITGTTDNWAEVQGLLVEAFKHGNDAIVTKYIPFSIGDEPK